MKPARRIAILAAFGVSASFGGLACAQGDAARLASGRVVDVHGKPIAGATVTLLHRPIPWTDEVGHEDRHRVVTDAEGRFRAPLLEGRPYSAWASWQGGATGFEEGVTAGDFVALAQDPRARSRTVWLTGTAPWAARAPLSVRVSVGSENLDFVTLAGDPPQLPALPPSLFRCHEVLGSDGETIWARVLGERPGDRLQLALPPPRRLVLDARDENGAPLAGVEIRRHLLNHRLADSPLFDVAGSFRGVWPRLGTTNGDGALEADVADLSSGTLFLLATAPGRCSSLGGIRSGVVIRDGDGDPGAAKVEEAEVKGFSFTLSKVAPARTQIGALLADGPVFAAMRIMARVGSSGYGEPFPQLAADVREGVLARRFALDDHDSVETVWAQLADPYRKALAEVHGCTLPPSIALPAAVLSGGELPPLPAVTDWFPLQVFTPDGRPAARAAVCSWTDGGGREAMAWARTDRRGRVLLRVRAVAQRVAVVAAAGHGMLAIAAGARAAERLELSPPLAVTGVVRDDGGPVAGVAVRALIASSTEVDVPERIPASVALAFLRGGRLAVTDGEGRFRLALFPAPVHVDVQVANGGRAGTAVRVMLDAVTALEPLQLRPPNR